MRFGCSQRGPGTSAREAAALGVDSIRSRLMRPSSQGRASSLKGTDHRSAQFTLSTEMHTAFRTVGLLDQACLSVPCTHMHMRAHTDACRTSTEEESGRTRLSRVLPWGLCPQLWHKPLSRNRGPNNPSQLPKIRILKGSPQGSSSFSRDPSHPSQSPAFSVARDTVQYGPQQPGDIKVPPPCFQAANLTHFLGGG